jgi:hypothetical protein
MLLLDRPMAQGGRVLGFEPLNYNITLGCSWLCNGLESDIARELDIHPNPSGLIEGFTAAQSCLAYITREDVEADPGLWLPWLIVDHSMIG